MAKKKKRGGPPPAKKKKQKGKNTLLAQLLAEHPSLSKDEAKEILSAGMTYEEWQEKRRQEREARRIANQKRMIALLCSQYKNINEDEAKEIIEANQTPEEFLAQRAAARREREREQRRGHSSRGRRGPSRGKPYRKGGGDRRGGGERKRRPVAKKKSKREIHKEKLDALVSKYPDLTRAVAGQLLRENISFEEFQARRVGRKNAISTRTEEEHVRAKEIQAERMTELSRRLEEEAHLGQHGDVFLEHCRDNGWDIEVLRFHARSFCGSVKEIKPLLLALKTETQNPLLLRKLGCSLLYRKQHEAEVLPHLFVDLEQMGLLQYPSREPKNRYKIPQENLELGSRLRAFLHDGLIVQGEVVWKDRFQFLLRMVSGVEVFVFRHSVDDTEIIDDLSWTGELSYLDYQAQELQVPQKHPQELPVEDIFVPIQFDDYNVRDARYLKILSLFEQGKFEIHPLRIRREGSKYVLLDGYRRLTLAKEKEIRVVPVIVA